MVMVTVVADQTSPNANKVSGTDLAKTNGLSQNLEYENTRRRHSRVAAKINGNIISRISRGSRGHDEESGKRRDVRFAVW